MKINIKYLEKIRACRGALDFFYDTYQYKNFDLLKNFNKCPMDWQVWFLGVAKIREIKYLLDNQVWPNLIDHSHHTPLMVAAYFNKLDNFKLLLK